MKQIKVVKEWPSSIEACRSLSNGEISEFLIRMSKIGEVYGRQLILREASKRISSIKEIENG